LVIHNPKHPETSSNLVLLDVAGGYFSRIEYASGGSLPGSLIAEFAHIAREHVNSATNSVSRSSMVSQMTPSSKKRQQLVAESEFQLDSYSKVPTVPFPSEEEDSLMAVSSTIAHPPVCLDQNLISIITTFQVPSNDPSSQNSTPTESLSFPLNGTFDELDEQIMGTDVMDLFNYSIPGIDPIFSQGALENEFLRSIG
jgi:hypothetical protein